MYIDVSADHRAKMKASEKRNKSMDLAEELKKKAAEHEDDCDTNNSYHARNSHQFLGKETGWIKNQRKNRDYTDRSNDKIGENSQKSPDEETCCHLVSVKRTPVYGGEKILLVAK